MNIRGSSSLRGGLVRRNPKANQIVPVVFRSSLKECHSSLNCSLKMGLADINLYREMKGVETIMIKAIKNHELFAK